MIRYLVLLRGINVGGRHVVKMAELKSLLADLGMSHVQTYIQSGNVILDSELAEEELGSLLEQQLQLRFGFEIPVILRTVGEWHGIIERCPFSLEEAEDIRAASGKESLYISFLEKFPAEEALQVLLSYKTDEEEVQLIGRELYLLVRKGISDSKLANQLQVLQVTATTRNWKTVEKLRELAGPAHEAPGKEDILR
ncbi:DUF1697 domain-containing protein [Paenibacillus sp. JX-17]|uniref:DUF1697 domain-containing protein n=1 Tax=Paenibacillus lacisoli TaxID=3064525 RepID=A0ABT9CGL5_9BACL|nr:DUF1697 domain-containing protein [Paenibacillus sp. JX-17]MDO7907718.1 DUF1697 domain-containing protein [Paenibacillus sp. JX-17]